MPARGQSTVLAPTLRRMALSLAKTCSHGIEIGAVGRQVERGCADRLNGLVYAGDLVGGEVVHDDDVARGQGRDQGLLDPGKEACAVDRAIENAGRGDPVVTPGGNERGCLPVAMGNGRHHPFAARLTPRRGLGQPFGSRLRFDRRVGGDLLQRRGLSRSHRLLKRLPSAASKIKARQIGGCRNSQSSEWSPWGAVSTSYLWNFTFKADRTSRRQERPRAGELSARLASKTAPPLFDSVYGRTRSSRRISARSPPMAARGGHLLNIRK